MFNDLKFDCPTGACGSFAYFNLITHLQNDCKTISLLCPYGCGMKGNREEMLPHLQYHEKSLEQIRALEDQVKQMNVSS